MQLIILGTGNFDQTRLNCLQNSFSTKVIIETADNYTDLTPFMPVVEKGLCSLPDQITCLQNTFYASNSSNKTVVIDTNHPTFADINSIRFEATTGVNAAVIIRNGGGGIVETGTITDSTDFIFNAPEFINGNNYTITIVPVSGSVGGDITMICSTQSPTLFPTITPTLLKQIPTQLTQVPTRLTKNPTVINYSITNVINTITHTTN